MFENKKIFILGMARSGYEVSKFLAKRNNNIVLNDGSYSQNIEHIKELEDLGVKVILGSHPDDLFDESYDYLIKNPGVPIDHKYALKAKELGVPVINEVEMAYQMIPKDKNIKIVSITGTNGKTTTTTLIYEMIKRSGRRVHLAGNIGYPLSSKLELLEDNDIIVLEISCQQLENVDTFRPDVAVMTNIDVAHIEFMKTYEHYKEVKSRIIRNMDSNNVAIVNGECDELLNTIKDFDVNFKYFSSKRDNVASYLKDNAIYYLDEKIIDVEDIKLIGVHNYENIMAAVSAVKEFGVDNDSIIDVLTTFTGVAHRLEFVRNYNGVLFYNDTEATNIKCTQIALNSFNKPTIVILGGYERGQDFNDLKDFSSNIKAIVAIGACRNRVKEFAENINVPVYVYERLGEAMNGILDIMASGDVVLLSPASASWDQYKQCEDRGDEFKEFVNKLN